MTGESKLSGDGRGKRRVTAVTASRHTPYAVSFPIPKIPKHAIGFSFSENGILGWIEDRGSRIENGV